MAHVLCDRHAQAPDRVALVYEDAVGQEARYTFAALRDLSAQCAGVLHALGVSQGDRVATLLPKTPELLLTTLALWRLGAVHVSLFTACGPQAMAYRVGHSGTRVLISDTTNRAKIAQVDSVPGAHDALSHLVTVEGADDTRGVPGDIPFWAALEAAAPVETPVAGTGEDGLILLYTSGTTGEPKGVEVPVQALAAFEAYMRFGLDLQDDDVYWTMADPGWAYGLYYALLGPLLLGQATLFFNAPFDVQATYRILQKYRVTNVATAPTAFRMMRAAGGQGEAKRRLQLRVASSAGEPLHPDVLAWAVEHLGVPIHDQYGQTELGMVVTNHHLPALQRPLRPGSMGHAMPGFRVAILDESGTELGPGHAGHLFQFEEPQVGERGLGAFDLRRKHRLAADIGVSASSKRAGPVALPYSLQGRPRSGSCESRPRQTGSTTSSRWRAQSQPHRRARGGGQCAAPRRSWRCPLVARRTASAYPSSANHHASR